MINAVIEYSDGRVTIHSSDTSYVGKKFTKGVYSAIVTDKGLSISRESLQELHTPFKSEETAISIQAVDLFFEDSSYKKISELGFIHKLGILFYGEQGTGKSSLMSYISARMVANKEAIVISISNGHELSGAMILAKGIREIQDTPIVFIADEFDRYCKEYEPEMKDFLDGQKSIDNSLFLAATNYLDRVPDTIKKRPSRFKYVLEIRGITEDAVAIDIAESIVKRVKPKAISKKRLREIISTPCTIDHIKHKVLEEVLNVDLPDSTQKTIGFNKSDGTEGSSTKEKHSDNKEEDMDAFESFFENLQLVPLDFLKGELKLPIFKKDSNI